MGRGEWGTGVIKPFLHASSVTTKRHQLSRAALIWCEGSWHPRHLFRTKVLLLRTVVHVDVKGKWLVETDYIQTCYVGSACPNTAILHVLREMVLLDCANSGPLPENAVSTH